MNSALTLNRHPSPAIQAYFTATAWQSTPPPFLGSRCPPAAGRSSTAPSIDHLPYSRFPVLRRIDSFWYPRFHLPVLHEALETHFMASVFRGQPQAWPSGVLGSSPSWAQVSTAPSREALLAWASLGVVRRAPSASLSMRSASNCFGSRAIIVRSEEHTSEL